MATMPDDAVGDLSEDPTTSQEWTPTKSVRYKRGIHGVETTDIPSLVPADKAKDNQGNGVSG